MLLKFNAISKDKHYHCIHYSYVTLSYTIAILLHVGLGSSRLNKLYIVDRVSGVSAGFKRKWWVLETGIIKTYTYLHCQGTNNSLLALISRFF